MRSTAWWATAVAVACVLNGSLASAVERPVASSPGSPSRVLLTDARCPTFSWGAVAEATSHELVVYGIEEAGSEPVPLLRERLPGSVATWTPSLDRCLERGRRYAWAVRAVSKEGITDWSTLRLFEVAGEPGEVELGRALAVVERYLRQSGSAEVTQDGPPNAASTEEDEDPGAAGSSDAGLLATGVEISDLGISIGGEAVVTTATDQDTMGGMSCASGQVAKWDGGAWQCEDDLDTNTLYFEGFGLDLAGTTFSVDTAEVQQRVTGDCPAGESIRVVNQDGTVTCEVDDDTTFAIGAGLVLVDGVLSLDPTVHSPQLSTLDSTGDVGYHTSIAIGADGLGLISYRDLTNTALKVAHCEDTACTSATLSTLDSADNVGTYTSIAIGTDGLGLISYRDETNTALKVAHCENTACTSATVSTLDSAGVVGAYSSIAIGTDGLGLISYYEGGTVHDLKVAHCDNTACTTATTATLDSSGNVGRYTSIAIGSDGLGLISYYDSIFGDLKLAYCDDTACSTATSCSFSTVGFEGTFTSIAVNADGMGMISHMGGPAVQVIMGLAAGCSGNSTSLVALTIGGAEYTSMAVPSDGRPLISYYDLNSGDLRVARCNDGFCYGQIPDIPATSSTVDSSGDVGAFNSIAIGTDGLGLISYRDATNGDLKVAHLGIGVP